MSKSIKKNYLYNAFYQIFRVIAPLLTTPYVSRVLSTESIGIYGFTISIVTYFILIGSLGIDLYGQREIAFARDNIRKRSEVFWSLFLLKFITMSIASVIFFLLFARTGDLAIFYRILMLEILASFLDIAWLFQGLEEFKKTAVRNIIVKLLSVVLIFCFVKTANDLWIYLLIYCLATLFGSLTLWPSVRKYIEKPKRIVIKPHLKPVLILFLPQIAVQVYTVLDKSMLGWLSDMDQVGYYEQVQKIVKVFLAFITALGTVMMPRIASHFVAGETDKIREFLQKAFRFVFFVASPILMGIIAISPRFVPLFLGGDYADAVPIMQIISVIILLIGLSNVSGIQFLLPTKRQKEYTISILAGTFVNVLLNLLFIPFWKGNGAAIATVVAELAVTMVQLFFIRKEFSILQILRYGIKYLVMALIMYVICILVDPVLPAGWLGLTIECLIGAAVYVLLLVITKDYTVIMLRNTFKKQLIKRKVS